MRRSHLWSVFQVCVCNVQPETSKDPHRGSHCPIQNRKLLEDTLLLMWSRVVHFKLQRNTGVIVDYIKETDESVICTKKNPTLLRVTKYQREAWAKLEIWQGVTLPYERGIIGVCRGMSKRPSPFKLQRELIFLFENQNWNWITGVWRGMPETQSPQIIYCIFSKLKILGHTWYCKTDYIMSVLITFWV